MQLRVLGPLEVVTDSGDVVSLGGRKPRLLLARLLRDVNRVVSVDQLIDALWGETAPPDAHATLQVYVSRLRRALHAAGVDIVARSPGYLLRVGPDALDADVVERLVAEARGAFADGAPGIAAEKFRQADALWRGDAFAEFSGDDFARTETSRLEELRLAALEDRIDADLALGRHTEVAGELDALVAANPLRERLWAQLMLALYRAGRQAEALRAFRRAATTLVDELGIDPGPDLQRLEARILHQDPDLMEVATPRPAPAPGPPSPADVPDLDGMRGNLPTPLSSLIGRARELAEVGALSRASRLVTLTGPGGVGKTRLVLAVAATLAAERADGTWLVELAPVADPDLVARTIGDVLGIPEVAGQPMVDTLAGKLRERGALLVLDNCEHVVDAVAHVVAHVLAVCPRLGVFATSREALGVAGEVVYPVPLLAVPDPDRLPSLDELESYESVRLLCERGAVARPGFRLDAQTALPVATICRRLDGLPLALELAAARLRVLSAAQIAERLADRFHLLTGTGRGVLPRQRTLAAVIDWSHDLLTEQERILFRRLSVFAGGCTLEAAESVGAGGRISAGDVLDGVSRLAEKSLLSVAGDDESGPARYWLLETLREYGRSKLVEAGEEEATRLQHAAYYAGLAEAGDAQLRGAEQQTWFDILEIEQDNMRGALDFGLACPEPSIVLRLAGALAYFWQARGRFREGRQWLERALEPAENAAPALRAKVLEGAAALARRQSDLARARELAEESIRAYRDAGDRQGLARALTSLAGVEHAAGDATAARLCVEEAASIFAELGDEQGCARSLSNLGVLLEERGDLDAARARFEEALPLFREIADARGVARVTNNLGSVALRQGDFGAAGPLLKDALERYIELGDQEAESVALLNLGDLAEAIGDHDAATTYLTASLRLCLDLGDRLGGTDAVLSLARLAYGTGEPERSARLLAATTRIRADLGSAFEQAQVAAAAELRARLRADLGEDDFGRFSDEGAKASLEDAARPGSGR